MTIKGPQSRWERFRTSPALLDLLQAVVVSGGFAMTAGQFFAAGSPGWASFSVVLALLAAVFQILKARANYEQQRRKDSTHELLGCLHTLETVLLGASAYASRQEDAGLRLTVHTPDGKGHLVQAMNYVGDQRTPNAVGRRMPETSGVVGQAYREAKLDPKPRCWGDCRTSHDYDAFVAQMVSDYAFSPEAARKLNPATMSWLAVPITNRGTVEGVLYLDSKQPDFFTDARREDVLHAAVGIAYFVSLRYA